MPLYKSMTAAERLNSFQTLINNAKAFREGIRPRIFGLAPEDRHDAARCDREASFLLKIARSCGDAWAWEQKTP